MPGLISDTPLASELIRIGDEAIAREDDAALRAYLAEGYVFHGPGSDLSFDELSAYFASSVSRSSSTATSWPRAPRSPATSPAYLPTRRLARSSPPASTSSGR